MKEMKKIKLEQKIKLGENVVVSDPCYELEPKKWPQIILTNVKPGDYVIEIYLYANDEKDGHIFTVTHVDDYKEGTQAKAEKAYLGIDSGQICISPLEEYLNDSLVPQDFIPKNNTLLTIDFYKKSGHEEKSHGAIWYDCLLSKQNVLFPYENEPDFGLCNIFKNTFNCHSGYGDGSATLYVDENEEGQVYRMTVVF